MDALSATEAAFAEASAGDASPAPQDTTTSATVETPASTESTDSPATQGQPNAADDATAGSEGQTPLAGNIPAERHKAILEKTRKEYDERLARLAWAEKLTVENPETLAERLKAMEFAERSPVEFLMRFRQRLANDPRYAGMFQRRPAAQEPPAKPEPEPRPEPDMELEDGRRFYSDEQQQKLLDWQERRIAQRFAPVEQHIRGQQAYQAAMSRNAERLTEARGWEGFTQYEADIRAYMEKDGRATLESAYRNVVVPKLKADRAAIEADLRKSLLAELNAKPTATTEQPNAGQPAAPKSYKGWQTSDVVRDSFDELSRAS